MEARPMDAYSIGGTNHCDTEEKKSYFGDVLLLKDLLTNITPFVILCDN